jgi:hypothetical protein
LSYRNAVQSTGDIKEEVKDAFPPGSNSIGKVP